MCFEPRLVKNSNFGYHAGGSSGIPRVSGARGEDENWRPLPGVSDWQTPKAISFAIWWGSGAPPQPPTLFGVLECKWNPFLNSFSTISTRRVRLTSAESAFPCYCGRGSGAEPQPPTLLGAFGCEWSRFLNCVNTIFNSACKTGKRRRPSPSLLRGLGQSPSSQRLGRI